MKKIKFDTKKVHKLIDISKKLTTPTAYSAYASVGVIVTTVLAIVCTKKQCAFEEEAREHMQECTTTEEKKDFLKDYIKNTAQNYSPVIFSAAATIHSISKCNNKWKLYNNVINAAFMQSRDKMARYRTLASSAVAAEVVKGLDGKKSEPGLEWFCLKDIPLCYYQEGNGYDGHDIYFQSTKADVIEAEYNLNRNFQLRSSASLREFCSFLGIVDQFPEELGDTCGWDSALMWDWGLVPWIDFEHWNTTDPETGEVINVIGFTWEPGFRDDMSPMAYGYGDGEGFPYKGMFPTE